MFAGKVMERFWEPAEVDAMNLPMCEFRSRKFDNRLNYSKCGAINLKAAQLFLK